MELDRNTRLIAAPAIVLRHSGNALELDAGGQVASVTPDALLLLSAFWSRRSVGDALGSLRPLMRGHQAWAEVAATVGVLARAGVLTDETRVTEADSGEAPRPSAAGHPNTEYLHLLLDAIERGQPTAGIVVDLAPLSGLAGLVAARSGARRVVLLCSPEDQGRYRALFSSAGLQAQLATGHLEPSVPSEGQVLVIAERLGQEPVIQRWLEALGREGLPCAGRVVPEAITPLLQLVEVPPDELSNWLFTEANLAEWQSRYGMKFGPLGAAQRGVSRISVSHRAAGRWRARTSRVELRTWDLRTDAREYLAIDEVHVAEGGIVNAVHAASAIDFRTPGSPGGGRCETRGWLDVFAPFEVKAGDRIRVSFKATAHGTAVAVEPI